jgi:Predicted phosphohydrolases
MGELTIKVILGIVLLLTILFAIFVKRSKYERNNFGMEEFYISTDKLSNEESIKAVFISDLHNNQFGENNKDLISAINDINPDVILSGGDLIVCKGYSGCGTVVDTSEVVSLIEQLAAKYPVYMADGNHEIRMKENVSIYGKQYKQYTQRLKKSGAIYLNDMTMVLNKDMEKRYKNVDISRENRGIAISAVDLDLSFYKKFMKKEIFADTIQSKIGRNNPKLYNIMFIHSPEYLKEAKEYGADLVLSGHYHGGTVRLPLIGGLLSPQIKLFPKYSGGIYKYDNSALIVSRGLGTHSINIRFNNISQLAVIHIAGIKE